MPVIPPLPPSIIINRKYQMPSVHRWETAPSGPVWRGNCWTDCTIRARKVPNDVLLYKQHCCPWEHGLSIPVLHGFTAPASWAPVQRKFSV